METEALPIYEFLLWNNCSNNCKFCHQKANKPKYPGKFLSNFEKLKSIALARFHIETKGLEHGSHILFMGGELFDQEANGLVGEALLELAIFVKDRMLTGETGLLYMNTNLIYEKTLLLESFISLFCCNGLADRVRFTTSWDISGRFKNEADREITASNLKKLSTLYPDIKKVANCVLTRDACLHILSNDTFISNFEKTYNTKLNLIPYIKLEGLAAPERKLLLNLFTVLNTKIPNFLKNYVESMAIKQKRILFEYNHGTFEPASSIDASCGHNINFGRVYADSSACFVCDCLNLLKTLEA